MRTELLSRLQLATHRAVKKSDPEVTKKKRRRAADRKVLTRQLHPNSLSLLGHVVQFYTDDFVLLDGLAALLRGSLSAGDSVAAIMTSPHRNSLERRLIAQGIDVSEATKNGRLVILDADQALSEFMEAVGPSRERFLFRFGDRLRRLETAALVKNKRLVVFGEMVAVLWAQKRHDAANRLEEMWNELAQTCSFYLCCAYPASAFREKEGGPYATICAQHSDVVSAF